MIKQRKLNNIIPQMLKAIFTRIIGISKLLNDASKFIATILVCFFSSRISVGKSNNVTVCT